MSIKGWPLRRLGGCAKFLSGGTPSKARAEFWEGDIPWVSSGEMAQMRIHDTPLRITGEGAEDGSRLVPANTVLAVVRGMSLAKEFRVAITKREVAFNQDLKAFQCKPDVDSEFLFYALFARREHIRELATEASHGTKKLETDVLAAVELPVPTLDVQLRTVAVASAYDDLIENNRRRIALLEEAARQVYREWFVCLRFPGHEHTRIVDNIPEGWQRKKMSNICESVGGGTPSTLRPEFWDDGEITWVTPTDITQNDCLALLDSEKKITEAGLKNSSAKMLPSETILMTSRASLGFFGLVDREVCTNQGFISVIPHEENLRMYLLQNLISRREEIIGKASGATYKEINKSTFRDLDIVIPPPTIVEEFQLFAYDMLKQTRLLKKQMEKARAARDLLLPRLMSGEIRA
jgi:type I restriction enzyme S subunit